MVGARKALNSLGQRAGQGTWFIADPLRTDIDLVQHPDRLEHVGAAVSGPDWRRKAERHALVSHDAPGLACRRGWALTPEAAGVSTAAGRIPVSGPIDACVKRLPRSGGWRQESETGRSPARVTVDLVEEGVQLDAFTAPPGAFCAC